MSDAVGDLWKWRSVKGNPARGDRNAISALWSDVGVAGAPGMQTAGLIGSSVNDRLLNDRSVSDPDCLDLAFSGIRISTPVFLET